MISLTYIYCHYVKIDNPSEKRIQNFFYGATLQTILWMYSHRFFRCVCVCLRMHSQKQPEEICE